MNMLPEGRIDCTIKNWGLVDRGSQVRVWLEFGDAEGRTASWIGGIEGVYANYTFNTLKVLGFEPKTKMCFIEGMCSSTCFDKSKKYSVVVEYTTTQDGKTFANIKYINDLSRKNVLDIDTAIMKLAHISFDSIFGADKKTETATPSSNVYKKVSHDGGDDLPF